MEDLYDNKGNQKKDKGWLESVVSQDCKDQSCYTANLRNFTFRNKQEA